ALDQIDALEALVRRLPPPAGDRSSWADLVPRGALRGIPLDPAGTPYELDPVTGNVSVSPQSDLHPMPDEARKTLK
ncbi:MAG TPA: hypothetical protein VLD67_22140, partial [Vicinamibacterales bacterium]|nr:hypothetical protein [Vicinamibacterales bacterium]